MLFNSLEFMIFFAVVYALYLLLPHRGQNIMLLVASYLFYGGWDYRFLVLIWFSTIVDFLMGKAIFNARTPGWKRFYVTISVIVNLTFLGFFKYFNFFVENAFTLLHFFGVQGEPWELRIILPVGISFYTFQAMSYTIDIYRGTMKPAKNLLNFALFVAYFPQLVAGPIERATNLLPQVEQPRTISKFGIVHGTLLIAWGLFQKVFVADNMARIIDPIYAQHGAHGGWQVLLVAYAFFGVIYCDFAGYSNIARGLALSMGFRIMMNFNTPFYAQNPTEFWGRWHISFSTWLRDYVFFPLGGRHGGRWKMYRSLILTFFLGGLWHGADWTYVIWGTIHGVLLAIHRMWMYVFKPTALGKKEPFKTLFTILKIAVFFTVACLSGIFFRSGSLDQAATMFYSLFFNFRGSWSPECAQLLLRMLFYMGPMLAIEFFQWKGNDTFAMLKWPLPIRAVFYALLFYAITIFGVSHAQSFIYFQF